MCIIVRVSAHVCLVALRTPFAIVRVICVLVSVMLELSEREYVLC